MTGRRGRSNVNRWITVNRPRVSPPVLVDSSSETEAEPEVVEQVQQNEQQQQPEVVEQVQQNEQQQQPEVVEQVQQNEQQQQQVQQNEQQQQVQQIEQQQQPEVVEQVQQNEQQQPEPNEGQQQPQQQMNEVDHAHRVYGEQRRHQNMPDIYHRLDEVLVAHQQANVHDNRIMNERPNIDRIGRHRQRITALMDNHMLHRDRGLEIHPDIVVYANRAHDYAALLPEDQVRLNIIRLEIDRIRIEIQRRGLQYNEPRLLRHASCPICLNNFDHTSVAITASCGHVYCNPCFIRQLQQFHRRCSLCRGFIRDIETIQLFFRYNYRGSIICRRCTVELDENNPIFKTTCGEVFCQVCANAMTQNGNICFGCGLYLNEAHNSSRIYISYD